MSMLTDRIKRAVRDIENFPKEGIVFKDITPILMDPELCSDITDAFVDSMKGQEVDVVCGIESRGFFFGLLLANRLGVPFVPIRKQGKLPGNTISYSYDLEYGSATIEIHDGVLKPGNKVLIHDDLLATAGTALAATELVKAQGAEVAAFSFIVSLGFLDGVDKLLHTGAPIFSLVDY